MAISMEQMNALVWRYLRESGFEHSAFLFSSEANLEPGDSNNSQIPAGALVTYLQRALRYMKLERGVKIGRQDPENPLYTMICDIESRFPEVTGSNGQQGGLERVVNVSDEMCSILKEGEQAVTCRWNRDGSQLVTGCVDGSYVIWTIESNHPVGYAGVLPASPRPILTIDWNSSGSRFTAGSFCGNVVVYQNNGALLATFGHKGPVHQVRFSPNGLNIVSVSADRTAVVWSIDAKSRLKVIEHGGAVVSVHWKNDNTFATASVDKTIGIGSVTGGDRFLHGHTGGVNEANWSPNGSQLASGSDDKTVRIWRENAETLILRGHDAGVMCVRWLQSDDGVVISAARDRCVMIWDAVTGTCMRSYNESAKLASAFAISPEGRHVACCEGTTIDVASGVTGETVVSFVGTGNVLAIEWNPAGDCLAACFEDRTVVIPMTVYENE